ncbi:MAG TPA: cupin domain-containing protein [Acidobacteriaceae bacterium]|nr:cupin domain-containing protein [Acidobacteriaceae bacterium]
MNPSRRTLCQALPLLLAGFAQNAQGAEETLSSFAKPFDQLPVKHNGQNESRFILNGITHAGCPLEAHETTLAVGAQPHPPHHHEHEELVLMAKGTVTVTIMGKSTVVGPGSAVFFRSNEEHGMRNTGSEPAQYFVVAIGAEQ